jgi:hypothetical protein
MEKGMKYTLCAFALMFVAWAAIVLVVKFENIAALIFLLLGIYFLLARLIIDEQEKGEEMMGKLNRKVRKSKEEIYELLDKV